jgi:hypothetical protein
MSTNAGVPADSFRSTPTLGGRLSILNGLAWIALVTATGEVISSGNGRFDDFFRIAALVLSVPLATFLILFPAVGHRPTMESIVTEAIVIGLNSLIWGYGLAWFISKTARLVRREG